MGLHNSSSKGVYAPTLAPSRMLHETLLSGAILGVLVGNAIIPLFGALVGLPLGAVLALLMNKALAATRRGPASYAEANCAINGSVLGIPTVFVIVGTVALLATSTHVAGDPLFLAVAVLLIALLWTSAVIIGLWWKATRLKALFGRLEPGRGQLSTTQLLQTSGLLLVTTTVLREVLFHS